MRRHSESMQDLLSSKEMDQEVRGCASQGCSVGLRCEREEGKTKIRQRGERGTRFGLSVGRLSDLEREGVGDLVKSTPPAFLQVSWLAVTQEEGVSDGCCSS